jgi:putative ABC transport system ATP-binding protein
LGLQLPQASGCYAAFLSSGIPDRLRQLTKVYGEGLAQVHALAGVDLDLYAGELVVLLGPSGSGKTTLLNNLGGLDLPHGGELRYRDLDLTTATKAPHPVPARARRVRLPVLQSDPQPHGPGKRRPDHRDRPRSHAARARARNGPTRGAAGPLPRPTVRGEQQRVAIARAIAKRPEVLLCDEPTGALDVRTGVVVLEAIERANRELGTLTVIITHNAVMADMADRVIHLLRRPGASPRQRAPRAGPP